MALNSPTQVSSQGFEYGVKHFYNPKPSLITEILFELLSLNFEDSMLLLKIGAVYINNLRQIENLEIKENSLFRVHTKPRRYNCNLNWKARIVFENQDFIILNKPSGLPSHPSVDNIIENSLTQLSSAINNPLYITHRLDTLTSGLIVYAKNSEFVRHFNLQIQNRTVEKKYVALVERTHALPEKLIHYMEPSPRAPKKLSDIFTEGWAFCELDVIEQKKINAELMWIKINLLTGRTHQIRSQLAKLGAPILGDVLYGSKLDYTPHAIGLRAFELEFNWGQQRMQFKINEDFDI
jgi:23S rRNA pseudouridine1911/1915/1917 synthase